MQNERLLLKRPKVWDYSVYGVPIPQVDQMGAALAPSYMMALWALKKGSKLTDYQTAAIEQSRYLASLLGMHDQFLSNQPEQIVETWNLCQATLRHKSDQRGRDLNSATINAYRRGNRKWYNQLIHRMDVKSTQFMYSRMVGKRTAKEMGVDSPITDVLSFAGLFAPIGVGFGALSVVKALPGGRGLVDGYAIKEIQRQLAKEGSAEYRTNDNEYKIKSV